MILGAGGLALENRFWQVVGAGSPVLGPTGVEDIPLPHLMSLSRQRLLGTPSRGQDGDEKDRRAPGNSPGGQMGQPSPHGAPLGPSPALPGGDSGGNGRLG